MEYSMSGQCRMGVGREMSGIFAWIRGMVFYLILMTMIMNLLPDNKYEKYLQLFTGMVFLFLVFEPLAEISGLEAEVAGAFERLTFRNDAMLLREEIEDADGKRIARLVDGYADAVETDLKTMAEGFSLECLDVQIRLDGDVDSETFGRVQTVMMQVGVRNTGVESGPDSDEMQPESEPRNAQIESESASRQARKKANRDISELKKKIGEYYGLEESDIAINLEDE